jgi:segregation and condensation protein A
MDQPGDFESAADAFPVKLSNFEGPLDLLLHLIKKNEVSIEDIPIALITQQYLDAIHLMQEMNLDVAGEFLVMAATLIHIKSKMLLPRPETAATVEGEEEDPRDALVRRLLEHQKFKAAAELLHEREQLRSAQWLRPDERVAELAGDDYEPELEVDLFSLLSAFQSVVARAKLRPKVLLPPEQMPVEVRIEQLLERLSETDACGFEELFADVNDRGGLIVTFLALLEMIRLKLVRVFQSGSFSPIRIYKRARPADAPHPIGDPEASRG